MVKTFELEFQTDEEINNYILNNSKYYVNTGIT